MPTDQQWQLIGGHSSAAETANGPILKSRQHVGAEAAEEETESIETSMKNRAHQDIARYAEQMGVGGDYDNSSNNFQIWCRVFNNIFRSEGWRGIDWWAAVF